MEFSAIGGSVAAEHAEQKGEEFLGVSDGSSGQKFQLRSSPVIGRLDNEYLELRAASESSRWTEVSTFAGASADDNFYKIDSSSGLVEFGPSVRSPDGSFRQLGAIPTPGSEVWITQYRVGGGASGNLGANSLTVMRSSVPYVERVTNPKPTLGGTDAETVAEAKVRGPLSLVGGDRAVTNIDHERLAVESSSRIRRACCLPVNDNLFSTKIVLVQDPFKPAPELEIDDFSLDADLVRVVSNYLDDRRLIGSSIELAAPKFVGVSPVVLLQARSGRSHAAIKYACEEKLAEFLSPLNGGDGTGWPFGQSLGSGTVGHLISQIEGVERVVDVSLFEADLRNKARAGVAADSIDLESDALFLCFRPQVVIR